MIDCGEIGELTVTVTKNSDVYVTLLRYTVFGSHLSWSLCILFNERKIRVPRALLHLATPEAAIVLSNETDLGASFHA